MAIAAEFPDIDTVWSLRGPIEGFAHHRGVTHTLLGVPFEAAFLVGLAWIFHLVRTRTSAKPAPPRPPAPVHWAWLYGLALLALFSHILLDYTNNYGVRPLFPFNPHWFAGSFVFILDPLLLLLLLAGLFLPSLFQLVNREIGVRRQAFAGAGAARAALLAMIAFWGLRAYAHGAALKVANQQSLRAPASGLQPEAPGEETAAMEARVAPLLQSMKTWASPDPLNPFLWYVVTDFGPVYQLATVDTLRASYSPYRLLNKLDSSSCLKAAEQSPLGRVYLDWSPLPWLSMEPAPAPVAASGTGISCTVLFEDPRFMSSSSLLNRGKRPPLTGTVSVGPDGSVLSQAMDDRVER